MATTPDAINHWHDAACARAFWGQQDLPPYRQLLADTVARLGPQPGECWLDLGCGSGALTEALWRASNGSLAEVIGLDVAGVNARAFGRRAGSRGPAAAGRVRFLAADFPGGLARFGDGRFDGVVSGLAIQYAESFDPGSGRWTSAAYDGTLAEVYRLLRPGG